MEEKGKAEDDDVEGGGDNEMAAAAVDDTEATSPHGDDDVGDDDGASPRVPLILPTLLKIAPYQKLVIDEMTLQYSLYAIRLAIFVDSLTGALLQPNYALMCRENADPVSCRVFFGLFVCCCGCSRTRRTTSGVIDPSFVLEVLLKSCKTTYP